MKPVKSIFGWYQDMHDWGHTPWPLTPENGMFADWYWKNTGGSKYYGTFAFIWYAICRVAAREPITQKLSHFWPFCHSAINGMPWLRRYHWLSVYSSYSAGPFLLSPWHRIILITCIEIIIVCLHYTGRSSLWLQMYRNLSHAWVTLSLILPLFPGKYRQWGKYEEG